MYRVEINYGKLRRNDWKWSSEIDRLLELYRNKFCECGCGNKLHPSREQVIDNKYKGKPLRVLKGHHNKLPEAKKWLVRGKNHPFYGKHHTEESRRIMSMKTSGPNHPWWKGGITKPFPYRRGWRKIRLQILERDKYTCKNCKEIKESRLLHVHHKISRREFKTSEEAHKLENLILLCKQCHLTLENKMRAQRKRGELLGHPNGQSAAEPKDNERLLEGSTVRIEETIISTSTPP